MEKTLTQQKRFFEGAREMDGGDFLSQAIIFIIILWVLFIIVVVGIIRWVIRVNPRVNLLKKILAQLEQLNAKTPGRPSPQKVSAIQKSAAKPAKPRHILEQVIVSGESCTECRASIPSGEQPHLFSGRVVCKKCDRVLRKSAGLDDSVSTTKA